MLSTLQFLQETLWLQFCGTCWLVTTLDAISTPGALSLLKAQSQLGSSEHQGKQRTSPPKPTCSKRMSVAQAQKIGATYLPLSLRALD